MTILRPSHPQQCYVAWGNNELEGLWQEKKESHEVKVTSSHVSRSPFRQNLIWADVEGGALSTWLISDAAWLPEKYMVQYIIMHHFSAFTPTIIEQQLMIFMK